MYKNNTNTVNRRRGFTIIEIIVVVAVIGILLSIGIMSFANSQNRAKREQAEAVADKVKLVLSGYYSEKDRYPQVKSTVVSHLTAKGETAIVTAFSNDTFFTYAGTKADGSACAETGVNRCETYTITVRPAAWNGASSEADLVVTP